MSDSQRLPVLAGVGQLLQRVDDPKDGQEPLGMMISAAQLAGEDAGSRELLRRADQVRVIKGVWPYGDPGRVVAERVGARSAVSFGSHYGGNFVQANVNDAARAIRDGSADVVLVVGAENGRSSALAKRKGEPLSYSDAPGAPDEMCGHDTQVWHDAELKRDIKRPTQVYAMFESAIRAARGESIEAHRARISKLWQGFNAVAVENPHAWIRDARTAEEIGTASPDNPMICVPYPRMMNANSRVDMGAALLLCSEETARSLGVPGDKLVYLHAGTEAHDHLMPSIRHEFHRSPAIRIAGGRALELAGVEAGDLGHVDVYSCFPSAVQVGASELGLSEDRPLTVTGGLTFGGGPLNDYVLHSIARMAEVLREDRGAFGLVTANGGYLSKHAFGVYSTAPPEQGFREENLQPQVDALPKRDALVDFEGEAQIEAFTVLHRNGEPAVGNAACLTADGKRTWANTTDPDLMRAMVQEEFVGRSARVDGSGTLLV